MDEIVFTYRDEHGKEQSVRFAGREAAWLCFVRWLVQTGRITEEVSVGDADHAGVR